MSGRVKVRYCRAPTKLLYRVASLTEGASEQEEILACVSTGVLNGFQLVTPAHYDVARVCALTKEEVAGSVLNRHAEEVMKQA
jgi:hypothetical protein